MFSNIDEGVRWLSPLANGAALHVGLSQETLAWPFSGGRHLGLEEVGGIDVPPMVTSPGGRQTSCSGSSAASRPKRRCQRVRPTEPLPG
jgi:hypothetical protein